ncbi:HTTM domain-containing protein [Halopiger aswanensis]|uniref:Vitamin K-dependent gamma-carboxylase-like protein n=1 Tax=Halopiger aswanensis TaxID=148449 RepID=A0A3R7DYU4_9EURY|nr:HTTM domain-containing protein [Halopiger aswanensis]RKD94787.1 vitamin K-dependent gamma-carboxylase-like protein [Halopiger aswanensis]
MIPSRSDASTVGSRAAVATRLRSAVAPRLGIDPRALAAFRIALGLILLCDLLYLRVPGVVTFYTDAGTLPRSALAELFPTFEALSLHALSGSAWVQGLLFAVAGVFAGLLLVGYRTTPATLGSAILLASMQARNPYVLNGGDTILLSLLVLGLFLPLGARWSIDARRRGYRVDRDTDPPATVDGRVLSVATATVLVHFVTIYAVNGVLKTRSETWMNGTAVAQIFHLEQLIVGFGPYLADRTPLLVAANWSWSALLTAAPLLLVFRDRLRLALAGAFVGAQLGLAATMRLGAFPFVMVAALLLFFPPRAWDRLEAVLERTGLERRLESATDRAVATDGGRRLPSLPSIAIPPAVRRRARIAGNVALVCFLLGLIAWQAAGLGFVEMPEEIVEGDVEDVSWAFFAPDPLSGYWWFAWEADLESGETIDTLRDESGAIDRPPDAADRYPSTLWMRYGLDLRSAGENEYEPLAAYLCDHVAEHETEPDADLESVTVYTVEQPIGPSGPVGDLEVDQRIEYGC